MLLLGVASPAWGDEESRTPRRFFVGVSGGMGSEIEPSEFEDGDDTLSPNLTGGLDLGFQGIAGGIAFLLDADALPVTNVYRARSSIVLGIPFTTKYRLPCAAGPGYSCSEVYNYRKVRSVVGLKLGGEGGYTADGAIHAVEVGLAFRSQISIEMSAMYDPIRGSKGGAFDFSWQLGPFYWGMEMRFLTPDDQPVPLVLTLQLGYTPRMWQSHER